MRTSAAHPSESFFPHTSPLPFSYIFAPCHVPLLERTAQPNSKYCSCSILLILHPVLRRTGRWVGNKPNLLLRAPLPFLASSSRLVLPSFLLPPSLFPAVVYIVLGVLARLAERRVAPATVGEDGGGQVGGHHGCTPHLCARRRCSAQCRRLHGQSIAPITRKRDKSNANKKKEEKSERRVRRKIIHYIIKGHGYGTMVIAAFDARMQAYMHAN